ncbi:hypothetical protein ACFLSH_02055 [Bacteroidota bacterium]
MLLKNIINRNKSEIAFLIGNGINRYQSNSNVLSWDSLLIKLLKKFTKLTNRKIPAGISTTEFYDILELESPDNIINGFAIQKEVTALMQNWNPLPHHKKILNKIFSINAPVLTTNFDLILPRGMNLEKMKIETKGFTDFYPWSVYFSKNNLVYPTDGFGIWYINGMIEYSRSIRLGLTHYMGSVERARRLIQKGKPDNLFSGKNNQNWQGSKTWLHIIFNKSLCVFGLALEENEVFIRWLLIERAKYFKQFPGRRMKGWFVVKRPKTETDRYTGKKFFMERVGLKVIEVDEYDDIYKSPWE